MYVEEETDYFRFKDVKDIITPGLIIISSPQLSN